MLIHTEKEKYPIKFSKSKNKRLEKPIEIKILFLIIFIGYILFFRMMKK